MSTSSRNSNQEKAMTIIYDALTYEHIGYDYDIKEMIGDVLDSPFEEADFYVKEVVVKALLHKSEIVAHYYYIKDVEKPVVIDVAVRLAKKYLDDGDYKFINAVLDEVL
mgnify:CR=1 FL=1